ncbi:sulfite exporter TauE/SafE family protein [Streptomyces sp. C10-9-1]|uniref:urease accessory protein UreH domain-containing protein n=1 Tax=Streptomyces sp. C10-9-1 TaxID=1859285 RepID=UPI002112659A|nr:sulfite exporter TauE/SafE family protein [Streptomyces sp. C10-9-1]MCQ6553215.1 sulfite exporter TauE/SafE family protein [Streptomyces sp. C10-9-1]
MTPRAVANAVGALLAGAVLALLPAQTAQAHPLGNFTVSQYDGLVVSPGRLGVDHVEDLAEIPAAQERARIDTDGDDRLTESELTAWARIRCEAAAHGARLVVAGDRATVTAEAARAREQAGQAGLTTLRVSCTLTAPIPRAEEIRFSYRPARAATAAGWREITGRGDAMTLDASDVPQESVSQRLRAYPDDLLSSPPRQETAGFTVRPGGPALADGRSEGNGSPVASVLPRGADRWAQALTGLVARHELTLGFAAFALAVALGLGALHALAPGHGKTMMAAAATAGGRSSLRDVLALGASVTLTHTLGVFALGALITAGSAAAPTVVSWLTVASGALVALAGALLVRRAWRRRHAPGHAHAHGHPHVHTDGHAHPHGPGGEGGDRHPGEARTGPAGERVPAAAVHAAVHAGEGTRHPSAAPAAPTDHAHGHSHPHVHSHLPPAPGLRGVVLMGLAGGLVPSPSAVVVLVGAAALGQAWFGFLLVLAYGAGLALTLAAAGFAVVRLRDTTTRRLMRRPHGRLFALARRAAPLASAAVVLALGCGLLLRGVATTLG